MTIAGPQLVETDCGSTVFYKRRYLYSRHKPQAKAVKIVESLDIQSETLLIIPSPLLFYGIPEILKMLPSSCHILCVETDQLLMSFSMTNTAKELICADRLTFVRTIDPNQVGNFIKKIGFHNFRRTRKVVLSGGYLLDRSRYDKIIDSLDTLIRQFWKNRMTLIKMERMWVKNIFSNLARYWQDLYRPLTSTGKPVLIAGAGESLEYSLDLISRHREHLFILAVDTALPSLTATGITPDAVLVLEAQTVNALDFHNHGNNQLTLFCDLTSHPATLNLFPSTRHFILSDFADTSLINRMRKSGIAPYSLPALGSVGVAAVNIALAITTGAVLITGLDFCYQPGKPHARGAPSHVLSLGTSTRLNSLGWYKASVERPLIQVDGIDGCTVVSDLILHSYGANLTNLANDSERIYDLRHLGIYLPFPSLRQDAELRPLLQPGEKPSLGEENIKFGERKMFDLVSLFFNNEEKLLSNFSIACNLSLQGEQKETLIGLARKVDYVYQDFPDAHRIAAPDNGFWIRAAASAADHLDHLRKMKKIFESTRWS